MNLLHLHYFHSVAKEGGYTKASRALGIQQPAISRMVAQLEDSLGFPLFERLGREIRLTRQGREVFEHSRRIFDRVEDLKTAVGQLKGVPKGPLVFGAAEPIASHFVPEILERVLPAHPGLYPNIHSGPAAILFERIQKGDLEFGLFFHVPEVPESLKLTVLRKVRFHLVVRKDLRKQASVLESFIGSREIDDVATRSFPTLKKLKALHPDAAIKISSNNLTAHRSMVLRGLGVSVLPDFLIGEDLEKGRLVDILPREHLEFDLKSVRRETSAPSLNAETFLAACSAKP